MGTSEMAEEEKFPLTVGGPIDC